jgi:hypothetical protein
MTLSRPRRLTHRRRSGVTAVVAMLFMVLFAALAIGYYAQTTMATQVGFNEQRMLSSRTAAESGMAWMRYQLSLVQVPPLTPDDTLLELVYKDFTNRLEMTGNLGANLVYMNPGGTQIELPEGDKNYISVVEKAHRFRVTIKQKGRDLVVTTIGSPSETRNTRSAVELTFRPTQERGSFYDHGVAAAGAVILDTNKGIIQGTPPEFGSLLAMGAVTIGPGTSSSYTGISGDLYVPETITPKLNAYISVDGETDPTKILNEANGHINYLSPEELPEVPVADTSIFRKYATNTYVAGLSVYDNVLIPPNTNPTFAGPCTIRGVCYIQQPNYVKFSGNVTMQCIVATEDRNVGTLATNVLEFSGTGGAKEPVSNLPLLPQFEEVRKLTGSFIVAPGFDVKITGNYGTCIGDICGDRVSVGGSSTVNITGSIFTLEAAYPLTINGNSTVSVSPNPSSLHSGIRHTEAFYALPSTWREVILGTP